ncbi:endo alpha-1,4 polygalactosaminidase [Inquilinus sp. Marseille-Q2685]|uniref:endo alpha-1,4 polygalactosaminidase n=1 Tax=Inquilinus sp. Marseille-Q2685 TaxID=2866581 RepID=UPI001CE41565|nr:endo alpha-1,4 polygalactosaminidase [Inquilinus sp. Marseille-Q2685]
MHALWFRTTAAAVAAASVLAVWSASALAFTRPPANGQFDYQIGGAYAAAAGVAIVDRDRLAAPAPGKYSICYVNAFQTQPGDAVWWTQNHSNLLVKKDGKYVIDPDWPDEYILDTSTAAKRTALMAIVGPWIDKCAADGFKAVEPDNLDSWTRSKGVLSKAGNTAFAKLLVQRAHAANIAIAQKNTSELAPIGISQIGFDFAIVEECQVWSECEAFTDVYGNQVYEIEYNDNDRDADGNPVDPISFFNAACAARGSKISIIYRDRDVVPAGDSDYEYKWC